MTLEQKPAKGTSLTEALTVDRHASSAKFLRRLYRESAPNRAVRLAEERTFRSAKVISVRLKSRPKFQTTGRSHHDPGNMPAVGQAQPPRHAAHDHAARAGRTPRGRATSRVPRMNAPSEPGNYVPRPAEISSAKSSPVRPQPTTHPSDRPVRPRRPPSGHDRSDRTSGHDPIPADRPDRPSQRRGRPEARFEARFHIFKPGLTLSRL
ncbi:unnamed protein product [Microthlaspi erraticum]|uniref:Uncharacterized protein n=1 Tax=Microthlaspi erraticum TaxID=1685480 RepID=A0A6D2KJD7_9BRAS|nr:unnamed protein product [Microthlaspi erraticum]